VSLLSCKLGVLQINPSVAPNLVNTPLLAKDFGLNVAEQIRPEANKDFDNLITVEFFAKDAATQKVSATLVGNIPKIVAVNDFPVDVCPAGDMVVFNNTDRPGVLKVGRCECPWRRGLCCLMVLRVWFLFAACDQLVVSC
jgi:D-3-phosphoglycerate dehydrogenase / 2-oxoglutarate reductase